MERRTFIGALIAALFVRKLPIAEPKMITHFEIQNRMFPASTCQTFSGISTSTYHRWNSGI